MSLAIVTGSLTPYTVRLYDAFAERHGEDLRVFTCAEIEPHRAWAVAAPRHFQHEVLPGLRWHRHDASHVYANPSIVTRLIRERPEVLAVAAFSPTMALAVGYARATGTPYGVATDGTLETDPGEQSRPHAAMRRAMVPRASFGICASEASVALLERWGLKRGRGVVVPIVTAWDAPVAIPIFEERPFDVILAGGINERFKGVLFFAEVAARLAERGKRLRVRIAGKGPERDELARRLSIAGVDAHFDGALQPEAMAEALGSAKVLAFPSRHDPWGLVANEAVLCGTPVLGSPHATSSHHFVERFGVGLVRPLEVEAWAEALLDMLSGKARWTSFMGHREEAVRWFSLDAAVAGLKRAFDLGRGAGRGGAVAAFAPGEASRD
ncbi:MAG: glycosyltransferase [Hyphomicrobiaceae bacterium]